MSSVVFYPDREAQKVLDQIPFEKRNQFINDAIKSHRQQPSEEQNAGKPGMSLNAELERLLGKNCGVFVKEVDATSVEFTDQERRAFARLTKPEAFDILQSLRPPITLDEVVDMLTALGKV